MGVRKKRKRKITVRERDFFWYVLLDAEDFGKINLYIISEDKKFVITYEVGQSKKCGRPFIVVQKGIESLGLEGYIKGDWRRIQTPHWQDTIITPSLVETIIDWCFRKKDDLILVDWQGNVIENLILK